MGKNVAQLIKEATEAVKDVPDDLRPVAFQKAFDALAEQQGGGGATGTPPTAKGRRSTGGGGKRQTPHSSGDSSRSQLDQLDRTSYPNITQDATALANSLRVLQAANDELGIDGLSASDIAHVLTEKFRCRITRQAVSLALNRAGRFVNRHKEGNSVIFKIMSSGENHLSALDSGAASEPAQSTKKKSKSAKKTKATEKTASAASSSGGTSTKKTTTKKRAKAKGGRKSNARPGPKAALQKLIDDGYFAKPCGISDIIEHLRHSAGHAYKQTDVSPALVRLLREGALTRTQNSDNQYEYKNA
jgi:hypothetical protein